MSLSGNARVLLCACAGAIAHDLPMKLDLSSLKDEPGFFDEVQQHLAGEVEKQSHGRYTVRQADFALFERPVWGRASYLARCSAGAQEGTVMDLTDADDTFLIICAPEKDGLELHSMQSTPEAVASLRIRAAESAIERERERQAKEAAQVEVALIEDALRRLIKANEHKLDTARYFVGRNPSISKIAEICRLTDTLLAQFLADALK